MDQVFGIVQRCVFSRISIISDQLEEKRHSHGGGNGKSSAMDGASIARKYSLLDSWHRWNDASLQVGRW